MPTLNRMLDIINFQLSCWTERGGILRQGRYHIAPKNQLHENQPYLENQKIKKKNTNTNNEARIIGWDKIDG